MTLGAEDLVLSHDHYGQIVKIRYFFSSRRSGGAVDRVFNAENREFKIL